MAKKKYRDEQLVGPAPEPEGVLRKAGRGLVGGISAVGNLLDLPGSMVRDTAAGLSTGQWSKYNPLDQLLTPHRADNRVTGRDFNRLMGLSGRKDTWGNFGGGLATEIAMDPLTYLSFGGSALGKFGQLAKSAGIHGDEAARIFTKAMGKAPGAFGKRQARLGLTGDMIKQADPDAFLKLQGAASRQGFDLANNMNEAMGGLAKFWPTNTLLGTGKTAQKMAGFMDDVGDTIRNWKIPGTEVRPVGDVANLFNQRSLGATSRETLQQAGHTLDVKEAARAGVRQQVAHIAHERRRLGITDADFDRWLDFPQNAPAHAQPVVMEARQLFEGLPDQFKEWGGVLEDVNKQMHFAGADTRYKPRHLLDNLLSTPKGGSKAYSGFTQASMARADWTKGVSGGDAVLREMAKYVADLRQAGITGVDNIATELESKFGQHFHPSFISGEHFAALQKTKKGRALAKITDLEAAMAAHSAASKKPFRVGGKNIQLLETFKEAARDLAGKSDEALKAGVWGNDPLVDIAHSAVRSHEALSTIKSTMEFLAEQHKAGTLSSPNGGVRMGDLLAGEFNPNAARKSGGLAMTAGTQRNGAARKFWQLTSGIDIATLSKKDAKKKIAEFKELLVAPETAKHLQQLNQTFSAPESVAAMGKLWDSVTAFSKAMFTTADFVRFNTRNFPGGQFNNAIAEQYSNEGIKAALDLVRGGEIAGARDIPIVQQIAAQRGLGQVDDRAASQILSELAYAHEVTAHAGTGNPTHGQHIGGTLEDILSEIPGHKKFTLGGLGETLKGRPGEWNPKNWRVRGVAGAEETTMPWMRAGEQVGDFTEHMIRFPAFYALLKSGVDPAEAAKRVGEAQVRYQNRFYTQFEQKIMQRIVLFYKFFKGQLPFTLRMLSENPGGRLANVIRTVNRSRGDDELTPDWVKETASIPLGEQPDGSKRYVTGLGLPFEDPIQFASPSLQNIGLEALSRTNPAIKGPLEYFTGQSFFQKGGPHGGRPLEDLDPVIGRTLANIGNMTGLRESKAPVRYPGSGLLEHLVSNSPISNVFTKLRTATDPRKSALARSTNLMTGLKLTDVSPAAQDKELRNRVQRIEKLLGAKTFTETFLPADVKAGLSPAEQTQAASLNALKKLLDERSKARKKK